MSSKRWGLACTFIILLGKVLSITGSCSDECHPKNSAPHMFGICKSQDPQNFVVTEMHLVPLVYDQVLPFR